MVKSPTKFQKIMVYSLAAIILAAIAFVALTGCAPEEPGGATQTPVIITATPEDTPTPEQMTVTPAPTNRPDEGVFFDPLNRNTYRMYVRPPVPDTPYPGVDGRSQCQPRGGEFLWSPRPVEGGYTPPWIHCDDDNDEENLDGDELVGGVHYVKLAGVAGEYTWRLYDPVQLYAGQCYLVKLMGFNSTIRAANTVNEMFGIGRLFENGEVLAELDPVPISGAYALDIFWPVMPSRDTVIEVELGFAVNHAVYIGDSSVNINEIQVIAVPLEMGFCNLPTVRW